jgi:hypothetical protein
MTGSNICTFPDQSQYELIKQYCIKNRKRYDESSGNQLYVWHGLDCTRRRVYNLNEGSKYLISLHPVMGHGLHQARCHRDATIETSVLLGNDENELSCQETSGEPMNYRAWTILTSLAGCASHAFVPRVHSTKILHAHLTKGCYFWPHL